MQETDLVTFSFGIAIGVLLGMVVVKLGNLSIGLGMAGGLLISGILIGSASSLNPTFGRVPQAARFLLMDLGLMLFMAGGGLNAGGGMLEALASVGLKMVLCGLAITLLPAALAYVIGLIAGTTQGATGISAQVIAPYYHDRSLQSSQYAFIVAFTFMVLSTAQMTGALTNDLLTEERLRLEIAEKHDIIRSKDQLIAAVSHATITEVGLARLKDSAISELIVTDTVPLGVDSDGYPIKVLTVAELLGEAILRIHEGRSVTTLFRA